MKHKKRLAAQLLKTSSHKVRIAPGAQEDVSKAITRSDMRGLIAIGKIVKSTKNQHSRSGARKISEQKRKGRQKGVGTKKGKKYSSVTRKDRWVARVRTQRVFLRLLREKKLVTPKNYRHLYTRSKGGYFRNKRHIRLYMEEHSLIEKK